LVERVPTLANGDVSWNRAAGTMDVTYRLRAGLLWSDGQPLTASDVAFTWRLIVNPDVQEVLSVEGYTAIASIEVHDAQRFTLHFDRVYPKYLELFPAVLPEHRLRNVSPPQLATDPFWERPDVTSGPFKIADLVPDDHITLVRNDEWLAGRPGRRVHLDSIVYKVYPEVSQLLAAANAGQVSLALEIPDGMLGSLSTSGSLLLEQRSQLAYMQVTFNQEDPNPLSGQSPPWKSDAAVLQALRMAVNREGLVSKFFNGQAQLAPSPISSALRPFHDPSAKLAYDPNAAAQMLDAAGWLVGGDGIRGKNGRRLSFHLVTEFGNGLATEVRDELITEWRKLGVDVIGVDAHASQLFSGYAQGGLLERGNYEAGLWTWSTGPDPDDVYPLDHSSQIPTEQNQGLGSNFGRFSDPEIDRDLDRGRNTLNLAERIQAYAAFERAYASAGFELPLFERTLVVLASPQLHNLTPNVAPDTTLWNAADWWVD
jgi:peptide/nickel transport system substrate-binding protein